MDQRDYDLLLADVLGHLQTGAATVGIVGFTATAMRVAAELTALGCERHVKGIYDKAPPANGIGNIPVLPLHDLAALSSDVLVIASDELKEDLLADALPFIVGTPRIVVSGYGHLQFREPVFVNEMSQLLVPSLANGYPHTLHHIYQCLANAARLKLKGVIAEFGMFKGGTTVLIARLVRALGVDWPVIGFDTFAGFPSRRSPLDMYDHPGCVFTDLEAVKRYVEPFGVEVVAGDIVTTCRRLEKEQLILTFIDTDNYTPASSALGMVRERTVVGGAIVFDHFTGVDRFRYTLGERLAGKILLDDPRYFHLHATGVFYRQR